MVVIEPRTGRGHGADVMLKALTVVNPEPRRHVYCAHGAPRELPRPSEQRIRACKLESVVAFRCCHRLISPAPM